MRGVMLTEVLALIGGLGLLVAFVSFAPCLYQTIKNKKSEYMTEFTIFLVVGVLGILPYVLCEHVGREDVITQTEYIYDIDGDYITHVGKNNNTAVYTKADVGYVQTVIGSDDITVIYTDDEEPRYTLIVTTRKLLCFKTAKKVAQIYIPRNE